MPDNPIPETVLRSSLGIAKLAVDPAFDITPPVAKVPADAKTGWTLAAPPPGIDGGKRNLEVLGEVPCRHQAICVFDSHGGALSGAILHHTT